jgi:hypothetical protein
MKPVIANGQRKSLPTPGDVGRLATIRQQTSVPPTDLRVKITALLAALFFVDLLVFVSRFGQVPRTDSLFLAYILLAAILLGQACLLALGACLGTSVWYTRLGCFVVGLYALRLVTRMTYTSSFGSVVLLVGLLVAGLLLVARFFGVRICAASYRHTGLAPMQLSIRHIMTLTVLVAWLLPIGQRMLGILWWDRGLFFMLIHEIVATIGFLVLAAGIGFASSNATVVFVGPESLATMGRYSAFATFVQGVVLVVPLHFVRSWGFRLVWLPKSGVGPAVRAA